MKMRAEAFKKAGNGLCGVLLIALMTLTACGFTLREPVVMPPHMQKIYVQGASQALDRELAGQLSTTATVVDEAALAQAIVVIQKEVNRRRTLSVDTRGKVREQELHYLVRFSVRSASGEILLESETIGLMRDFLNDELTVLGQDNERATLVQDMRREMAQRLLRRIQSIKP